VHPRLDQGKIAMYTMFMIYLQNSRQISSRNFRQGQNAIQTQNNMSKLTCLPILIDSFGVGVTIFLVVVLLFFVGALPFVHGDGVGVLRDNPMVASGRNSISLMSLDHLELCANWSSS
jgi:hypothetical protein